MTVTEIFKGLNPPKWEKTVIATAYWKVGDWQQADYLTEPRKLNPKPTTEKTYSDIQIAPDAQKLAEDQESLDGE